MKSLLTDKRGFIFVLLAAGLLLVLCAFAGLALDVGRGYVVKGQLQNAADASALAGAASLYDRTKTPATLTWSAASKAASDFMAKNSADGKPLADCTVTTGYWNVKGPVSQTLIPSASPPPNPGLCEASALPCSRDLDCPKVGGKLDYCFMVYTPAIKVSVSKSPDNNNGAMPTFFAGAIGWKQFQPAASSVAFSGFPGSAPAGTSFPFAISECLKEDFLNSAGIFAGGVNPEITFTTQNIHTTQGDMLPGLWTDLLPTNANAKIARGYMDYLLDPVANKNSAPPELHVGQSIDLNNGALDTLYQKTQDLVDAGKDIVYMPVVQCNLDPNQNMQVKGFAKVQLIRANQPKHNTFVGRFLSYEDQAPPGASAGGVASNVVIPPKMSQ